MLRDHGRLFLKSLRHAVTSRIVPRNIVVTCPSCFTYNNLDKRVRFKLEGEKVSCRGCKGLFDNPLAERLQLPKTEQRR